MVKSLFTGVTGLKAHQQRMDMIGNNIANVNTAGYKADVMTFADVYYQTKSSASAPTATLGGINPKQVGYGVKVSSIEANFSQSGYNYTDNKTDIALDGRGFFQVMDGSGNIFYTRAGNFRFDPEGYLVNADGWHVLGVSGETDGVAASSDIIRAVIPTTNNNVSSATKLVNGTNVTVSVSAPSDYTNMSVVFKHADFPYATYANNTLTIFFNQEMQYDSKTDFDNEIQKALTAGGVTLPNDLELTMDFDPIPDDIMSKAASNTVSELKFSTTESTCRFHISKPSATGTGNDHAYIDFSVNDNTVTDTVKLAYGGDSTGLNKVGVDYDTDNGEWTITIYGDTTEGDITTALKKYLSEDAHSQYPQLSCTSFVMPSSFTRTAAMKALCGANVDPTINADDIASVTTGTDAEGNDIVIGSQKLFGVKQGIVTGGFDFGVQEKGAFADKYKIQFASKSGYGSTTASWEENTLTINITAITTIEDVNAAIKKAAGGDDKKLLTFYDIDGLDYGNPVTVREIDGSTSYQYPLGYSYNDGTQQWTDRYGNEVTNISDMLNKFGLADDGSFVNQATGALVMDADGNPPVLSKTNGDLDHDNRVVWNVATRKTYFGGYPSVNPKDGKDSFFTETAKCLSTFNLTDGRIGEAQSMDELSDYMITADGTIVGLHPIYGTMILGRVDIATFDNPNGLEKVGGTCFRATVASGEAQVKKAGEDGAASIVTSALEMSNVDLADEFTNMISTQRGYQANSRVVTVSDTMIEELLNLKR